MAIQELRTFKIDCDNMGGCHEGRTITVQGDSEYMAAYAAQLQHWLVVLPAFPGAEGGPYLCPEHFAEAIPQWERVNYNPTWLRYHPAPPTRSDQ